MKALKRLPIRSQLFLMALSSVLVILGITLYTYSRFASVIQANNAQNNENLMQQISISISSEIDNINRILNSVAYNQLVQDYMSSDDPSERFEMYRRLSSFILNISAMKSGIIDIVLIGENNTHLSVNGGDNFAITKIGAIPLDGGVYYSGLNMFSTASSDIPCLLIATRIYSTTTSDFHKLLGTVVLLVDPSILTNDFRRISPASGPIVMLLDRNGVAMASNDPKQVWQTPEFSSDSKAPAFDRKSLLVPQLSGELISLSSNKALLSRLGQVRRQELAIFLLAILALSVPFGLIIRNILRPLRSFLAYIQRIQREGFGMRGQEIDIDGYAEINVVAGQFHSLIGRIDSLTNELVSATTRMLQFELEKKNAEYAYLKSQINPHFLYNTLEAMKGLAIIHRVPVIKDMALALGTMLRYSIKGSDRVSLRDELRIAKSYIRIQQVKFANKFMVSIDIEETVYDCQLPKMILQPLIENAFYHGLEPKVDRGKLTISARKYGELIHIFIEDDGVGMDDRTLQAVREGLKEPGRSSDHPEGIGLPNVDRRIKLIYGSEYGLEVSSRAGAGTRVDISIPSAIQEAVYV